MWSKVKIRINNQMFADVNTDRVLFLPDKQDVVSM